MLLTDVTAHSSWLQAQAQGAAFVAQDAETPEISDEDSCVGMSSGCQERDMGGPPLRAAMTSGQQVEATVEQISAQNRKLIQGIHMLPGANEGAYKTPFSPQDGNSSIYG